ncbi:MAG: LytTR family transcriptional regulator, partial [Clostridiales Family XIII bacterium]|nr:LytTR family transcriptional regulator [Clostridiales Family XIII bacterium]
NFYRCHRAYLVNLDKVSRFIYYSKTRCDVGFNDIRDTIPVSKSNISVMQKLLKY